VKDSGASTFRDLQHRFAAHIRDPANNPRPAEVSPRRMSVYTELFFRNLEQLLAAGFPVIRRITPDEQWYELVREFMAHHRCRTPLFPEIGQEFADFLNEAREYPASPPFFGELARYEYLEVIVGFSEDDAQAADRDVNADLLDLKFRLSASARTVRYRFPVHRIGPAYQSDIAPDTPTYLLVYRDADDKVRFMELNAMSYNLVELVRIRPDQTARAVLTTLAESIGHPDAHEVARSGHALLEDFLMRGIIFGAK
jgi:uncharacterized protein